MYRIWGLVYTLMHLHVVHWIVDRGRYVFIVCMYVSCAAGLEEDKQGEDRYWYPSVHLICVKVILCYFKHRRKPDQDKKICAFSHMQCPLGNMSSVLNTSIANLILVLWQRLSCVWLTGSSKAWQSRWDQRCCFWGGSDQFQQTICEYSLVFGTMWTFSKFPHNQLFFWPAHEYSWHKKMRQSSLYLRLVFSKYTYIYTTKFYIRSNRLAFRLACYLRGLNNLVMPVSHSHCFVLCFFSLMFCVSPLGWRQQTAERP